MTELNAFHLPGFDVESVRAWRYLDRGDLRLRWPLLSVSQLRGLCTALKRNRQHLALMPVAEVVRAIDNSAAQLHNDLAKHVELLSTVTGYSSPVVHETLQHMLSDWRAPALHKLLRAELDDPAVLDHPINDPYIRGKQIAAYGFPLTFHVFSGNVPGVAVTSLIRSLLVKSATLGKTASGEPMLPVLFARALADVAPDVANCIAVTYWTGGTSDLEAAAAEIADVTVIYGGPEAIQTVSTKVPAHRRLVVHGPRFSFGIVGPKPPADTPAAIARAVAAYDQQGCVSPHVVYVTGDATRARKFAQDVAREMEQVAVALPRRRLTPEEAVAFHQVRTHAEFAGITGGAAEAFGSEAAAYSVIYEEDPQFKISCLNRVLYVKPIPRAAEVVTLLPDTPQVQSVALAGFDDSEKAELVRLLGLAGVSRITSFERLPWPPMHWHHDGRPPLGELLLWQDIEG